MIGTKVGSYTIASHLARGGMGDVYVATHELMDLKAVAKVLHRRLSRDKKMISRFLNDARAAAAIEHPGIVKVFDSGVTEDDCAYIVMERLRGETLAERIESAPPEPSQALTLLRQLAGVLSAAHERKIVHRDLKPENIFVVSDPDVPGGERVKVLDFGIAKLAQEIGLGSVMTMTGTMFGTPAYMAPEQCSDAARVDHRADQYALGCIFYELLALQPPFGRGGIGLVAAHLHDDPPRLATRGAEVPAEIEAIVRKTLEKQPSARYDSCAALIAAIDALPSELVQRVVLAPRPSRSDQPLATAPTELDGALGRPSADGGKGTVVVEDDAQPSKREDDADGVDGDDEAADEDAASASEDGEDGADEPSEDGAEGREDGGDDDGGEDGEDRADDDDDGEDDDDDGEDDDDDGGRAGERDGGDAGASGDDLVLTGERPSSAAAALARVATDTAGMSTPDDAASAGAWTLGSEATTSSPSMTALSVSPARKRRTGLLVALALMLAAAGGAAAYVWLGMRERAREGAAVVAIDAAAREHAVDASVDSAPDAGEISPPGQIEQLIAEARRAVDEQRWVEAIGLLRAVLAIEPEHAEGLAMQTEARQRWTCEVLVTRFTELAGDRKVRRKDKAAIDRVVEVLGSIAEDTRCRERVQNLAPYAVIRDVWLASAETRARSLARRKQKCDDVAALALEAERMFPGHEETLQKLEDRCRGRSSRPPKPAAADAGPPPSGDAGPPSEPDAGKPGTPDKGDKPGTPDKGDKPDTPDKPQPDTPSAPGEPDKPPAPSGGSEPVPTKPAKPAGSDKPAAASSRSASAAAPRRDSSDEAAPSERGDADGENGRLRLPQSLIWGTIANIDNRLRRCAKRFDVTGSVEIEVRIAPRGKAVKADVGHKSIAFQRCVFTQLRIIGFPKARMYSTGAYLLDMDSARSPPVLPPERTDRGK